MIKSLVESKLLTSFLIIEDNVDLSCQNLFASFLQSHQHDDSVKKINLICYENPPDFYITSQKYKQEKISPYNYFSESITWKNPSAPKTDLSAFLSNPESLSETVFFIDSISTLAYYHGFYAAYKNLHELKKHSKKIICIVHGDLFSLRQLEELYFLATTYIKLEGLLHENSFKEVICNVTYHKQGGKVIKQNEIFSVSENFEVSSRIKKAETPVSSSAKVDVETLTTFKLGLRISEEEKRARDELILPYVKTHTKNKEEFIPQPLVHDFEEDPDDDLDI